MMKRCYFYFFFFFFFLAWNLVGAPKGLYTMEDLEILYQQKNSIEFLEHARDIRPTDRNQKWKQMVIKMAEEFATLHAENALFSDHSFQMMDELSLWPELSSDEFFSRKKIRYLQLFYKNCRANNCFQRVYSSFKKIKYHASLETVDLFEAISSDEHQLPEMLKEIVQGEESSFYCQRKVVQKRSYDYLLDLWKKSLREEDFIEKSRSFFSSYCLKTLLPSTKNFFTSPMKKDPLTRELFYALLRELNLLSENEKILLALIHFLEGPPQGKLLNYGWSYLQKMGQAPKQREEILPLLLKLDPLPGSLFALADKARRDILMNHVEVNFPEYIDGYLKVCRDYRKGVGTYPHGSPTPYCTELIQWKK